MSVSVGGAIAKENVMTNDKPKKSFEEALEEMQQAETCRLFSPGPDFTIACSCGECLSKIAKLKRFEDEIKSKKKQVYNYLAQVDLDESLCLSLVNAARWTVDMLDLLFRKLEALSEKLGTPFQLEEDPATANLETVFLRLAHMLKDNGVVRSIETAKYDKEHYVKRAPIAPGVLRYQRTKANGRASALLHVIAQVEDEHEQEKKKLLKQREKCSPLQFQNVSLKNRLSWSRNFQLRNCTLKLKSSVQKFAP